MRNHRWLKIICLHMVGDPESKRLKVAALNLFHPTASLFFEKRCFHIATQPPRGEGTIEVISTQDAASGA